MSLTTVHEIFLGSIELPHKNWTWSVQPFLQTYKQTDTMDKLKYILIDKRMFRYTFYVCIIPTFRCTAMGPNCSKSSLSWELLNNGYQHGPLIDMILSIYLHWTRPQYKFYFGNFFHGPTSWCRKRTLDLLCLF